MSEPLSEAAAWGICADVLDLVITALTLALLVGGLAGVVAGVLFEPSVGLATAAVASPVIVLVTVVDRRNRIKALVHR